MLAGTLEGDYSIVWNEHPFDSYSFMLFEGQRGAPLISPEHQDQNVLRETNETLSGNAYDNKQGA